MLNAIRGSPSDLASSYKEEDAEDEEDDDDTEQGNLSEDDEPGWVMGTISKMVHQQKIFLSRRNDSIRVDVLRQSRQRHPGG